MEIVGEEGRRSKDFCVDIKNAQQTGRKKDAAPNEREGKKYIRA